MDVLSTTGMRLHAYGRVEDNFDRGAYDNVVWEGFAERPEQAMNRHKYCLLCSDCDVFSNFVVESMTCGCIPVVYRNAQDAGYLAWIKDMSEAIYNKLPTISKEGSPAEVVRKLLTMSDAEQNALSRQVSDMCRDNLNYDTVCRKYVLPVVELEASHG
jgi:hypothetical protein